MKMTLELMGYIEDRRPSLSMPILDAFLAEASVYRYGVRGIGRFYVAWKSGGKGQVMEATRGVFKDVDEHRPDRVTASWLQGASSALYTGQGKNRKKIADPLLKNGGHHLFQVDDANTMVDDFRKINEFWRISGKTIWDQSYTDLSLRNLHGGGFGTDGAVWMIGGTWPSLELMRYINETPRWVYHGMAKDRFLTYGIPISPEEGSLRLDASHLDSAPSQIRSQLKNAASGLGSDVSIDRTQIRKWFWDIFGFYKTFTPERGLQYWSGWLKASAALNGRDHVTMSDVAFSWLHKPSMMMGSLSGDLGQILQASLTMKRPTVKGVGRFLGVPKEVIEDRIWEHSNSPIRTRGDFGNIVYSRNFSHPWAARREFLRRVRGLS